MKWILTLLFMLCVLLLCVGIFQLCLFCCRKLKKGTTEEVPQAEC